MLQVTSKVLDIIRETNSDPDVWPLINMRWTNTGLAFDGDFADLTFEDVKVTVLSPIGRHDNIKVETVPKTFKVETVPKTFNAQVNSNTISLDVSAPTSNIVD